MLLKQELEIFTKTKSTQCQFIQLAIDRYNNDLKRKDIKMDWNKAKFAILFIESCNHGDGTTFILEPWQKFIVANLFGWYNKNGKRRYTKAYIEVARKNGKTELAAVIALIFLVGEGRKIGSVNTCATTREQASECYKAAKAIIKQTDWIKQYVRVKQYEIHNVEHGFETIYMKALSADAGTLDGLKPQCAIIDEYHAHPTDLVYNVIESGMGATKNPLLFTITTAGFLKDGPCAKERKYCSDMLNNIVQNDNYFAMVFTLDKTDDWKNPAVWHKANPNLNVSVDLDFLKGKLIEALTDGSKEINFKTKYLNIWTDTVTTWISDDKWLETGSTINIESLYGRTCYGGMDLSKSQDFSSLVLEFPPLPGETVFTQLYFFWLPEDVAKERQKRNYANYINWAAVQYFQFKGDENHTGYIEFTQGDVIDHQLIRKRINQLMEMFIIKWMNYDPVFTTTLVTELTEDGLQLHPFNQGFKTFAGPTAEFETMVLNKTINHGNNPVMRWQMSNVVIDRNNYGSMKVNKAKAENKVDGVVAGIMAHAAYMAENADKPLVPTFAWIKLK